MPRVETARSAGAAAVWRSGVQIAGTVLWCDAARARDLCFVSHAGVAAGAGHRKLLMTSRTATLREARPGKRPGDEPRAEVLVTPFGRPFSLGALRIELFPSGHVPGAASLVAAVPAGTASRRIAYAGDVNPLGQGDAPALAEACEVRGAEVLVVAAPVAAIGRPLPPRVEAAAQLVEAVTRALDGGRVPVVVVPALGGAQEAMAILGGLAIPLRLHPTIAAYAASYRKMGISLPAPAALPPVKRGRTGGSREVWLWPLEALHGAAFQRLLARLGRPQRIALSGMAILPDAARRFGVEEAVALSDHADLDQLVGYVRDTGARDVYVTVGYNEILVAALAAIKVRCHPLGPPRQMDLFS